MQRRPALACLASAFAAPALALQSSGVDIELWLDMTAEVAGGRFDPERDGVGLRGGVAPLSWQRSLLAERQADGRWCLRFRLAFDPGQPLPCKAKIERTGAPDAGWEEGANRLLPLPAPPGQRVVLQRRFNSPPETPVLRRSGRIEGLDGIPHHHAEPLQVQVWLPPAYDEAPTRAFPLLLLLDGQNQFDAAAAGTEWQMDEAAEAGVRRGELAPMILVAVASGASRVAAYSPFKPGPWPSGPALARHLVDEVLPAVDARWRTRRDRAGRSVGGSSLGGLMALWLALAEAESFGQALVVSPAVWWQERRILQAVRQHTGPAPRLWMDIGSREGERALADARALRDAVAARGWSHEFHEVPEAGHDEIAWARRAPAMLRFLYGPQAR